ncbi:hypothetical protein AK830_g10559 [Neonectria ditissima]|uniref:Zn(2)-C6 fungal-type domain-containing protein n=1 Tax=Neonectria ditissima TaxID=78410 RepID=A0A0P7B5V7_9HYPO|nr:hypothetical protein AK830_g10559 [Neonectria ditissima]
MPAQPPTGSLPRSHSTSTLGRRQACDRCSEQKVRCIRSAPASSTNDDAVAGDGEAVGLARCLRFYQRTGRPSKRSSSDLQWETHSKRPTRTSTPVPLEKGSAASSTIEVLATAMAMHHAEPESRATPVDIELDGVAAAGLDRDQDQQMMMMQSLELPETKYDISSNSNSNSNTNNSSTYEQCMAEFGLNGLEIWTGIPSLSTGSISPQVELELGQLNYPIAGVSGTCIMASDPPEYDDGSSRLVHRAEYETVASSFTNTAANTTNTTSNNTTNTSNSNTTSSTEAYIEQLADLNLAIFRSTRSLCQCTGATLTPATSSSGANTPTLTPVSLAWPFSGEIFEATSSLIKLIDNFTHQQHQAASAASTTADADATLLSHANSHSDPMVLDFDTCLSLDPSSVAVDQDANAVFAAAASASASASACAAPAAVKSAAAASSSSQMPDPGVALLILAAHQRLLSAFENMCGSIHRYLQQGEAAVQQDGQQQQQQPYGGQQQNPVFMPSHSHSHSMSLSSADAFGGPAQTFAPSSTAQFVVVVELITYYLNRLDRALGPAVSGEAEQGPDSQAQSQFQSQSHALLVQPLDVFDLSSGSSDQSSPDFCTLGLAESYSTSSHTQSSKASDEGGSSSSRALMKVGHEMQDRYEKLREHIRVIKRVIRVSNDS